ncbi:MAG: GWxTD domain-containing protein [Acidobacteriota bacterium]
MIATKRLAALLLLLALSAAPAAGQPKPSLPDRYDKWLNEEVPYLITKHEREVFLKLQTDRERDIFVEAFWKHRDPDPATPRNEYEEEHYKRLNYANSVYGRSTPVPGWKTDRGRIYILLGPPKNVEAFTDINGVYPVEIWFYLGDQSLGLPAGFNVIFFKRNGTGDFILYSPAGDGPGSLVADMMGGYRDSARGTGASSSDQAAYKALKELAPNLAPQTLSLIPGETVYPGRESLASNRLMAQIYAAPQKKVETAYADAILKYKDFVDVEYTANYVAGQMLVQVIRDPDGASFVNYTIEPARITAEESGGGYEVRFRLTGRVSDGTGRTVYQFDKDFPVSLTAAELESVRAQSLSVQDAFPLLPGRYNFDILVKNVLSKEFTGSSQTIDVPEPGGSARLSPLLLAYGAESRPSGAAGERVPFKAGQTQLLCQAQKTFASADRLILFFQVYGATEALRSSASLRYDFLREDKPFRTRTARLAAGPAGETVIEPQPLADFPPGYYQARVTLLDGQGREMASAKENFEVSPAPAVPRPRVVSSVGAAPEGGEDLFATGLQAMNLGDLETARARLAAAQARAPRRPDIAVAYAQALFRLKDYRRVKEVLGPWTGAEAPAPEVPALYGQACHALGEYQEAIKHYADYLARFGANIDILNWLGTCHYQLGNTAEALAAWTKSLEINPGQDKLRALVDSIKKK